MRDADWLKCRVCGLIQSEPPWGESGVDPTWCICDCCGTEFGYEDNNREATESARQRWISAGFPWFSPERRPAGWTPDAQLAAVPKDAPWWDDRLRPRSAPPAAPARSETGRRKALLAYAALSVLGALILYARSASPGAEALARMLLVLASAAVLRALMS